MRACVCVCACVYVPRLTMNFIIRCLPRLCFPLKCVSALFVYADFFKVLHISTLLCSISGAYSLSLLGSSSLELSAFSVSWFVLLLLSHFVESIQSRCYLECLCHMILLMLITCFSQFEMEGVLLCSDTN